MENYQALLQELQRQEDELQFNRFTNDDALQLGLALVQRAKASAVKARLLAPAAR